MISMKTSEKRSATLLAEVEADTPEYPYGLRINLDDDSLKKLGITELPEVGTTMTLQARVEVVSVSQHESDNGKHRDMSLQITDMTLEASNTKDTMYPNSNMN
ncbi:hypothetical protein H0A64_09905 [Alcaligenaceae bacterium]|nr:hypothetical protein [Alcaligenaceae bacterium]